MYDLSYDGIGSIRMFHKSHVNSCRKLILCARICARFYVRLINETQSAQGLLLTVTGLAAWDEDEDHRMKAWIWVCSSQSYEF